MFKKIFFILSCTFFITSFFANSFAISDSDKDHLSQYEKSNKEFFKKIELLADGIKGLSNEDINIFYAEIRKIHKGMSDNIASLEESESMNARKGSLQTMRSYLNKIRETFDNHETLDFKSADEIRLMVFFEDLRINDPRKYMDLLKVDAMVKTIYGSQQLSKEEYKDDFSRCMQERMDEERLDSLQQKCIKCGKTDSAFKCSMCKAFYCSKQCQRGDWGLHKVICRSVTD